ncbi:MAG: MFS transporter [Desulfovermiculus sp.]|nr:MFS transporter [Desulfovermiculus sp.]
MNRPSPPPLRVAWIIWSLGAVFYLLGFFQRVAPAVMTEELMRDFQINATALGNLSAFYFYSYVAMQIPTGIIADNWGPRKLLSAGALVAGVGTVVFALAPDIIWASIGRLFIGGSVAVAFVGLLKLASNWFPVRYFATVTGLALFFGIAGAVCAGPPLRLLMDALSWRSIMFGTALLTLGIGAVIWIFVRDYPQHKGYSNPAQVAKGSGQAHSLPQILKGVLEVFTYKNTILLFIIPGGIVGCSLTFSGLWGVPYLTTQYGMSTALASTLTTSLLVAWAAGGPVFGWLSDSLGRRKPLYLLGCLLCLAGWYVILLIPILPFYLLVALLLGTGFSSGCMVISFAFAKESMPPRLAGTVSGVINMGVMLGPTILQPAVGWVLDQKWQGEMAKGIRVYTSQAYQSGFSLMLVWAALSLLLLFFTRETYCRQHT